MNLSHWLGCYGKLSSQLPVALMRVVYTKSGSNLADCFVQDETAAVDSQMYWTSGETKGNYMLDNPPIRHSRGCGNPWLGYSLVQMW